MIWRVLAAVGLAGTLTVNYLANALPIAGRTTAEISDRLFTLVTPAGFTFAVWGLIYLALAVYVVYQLMPERRGDATLTAVAPWFVFTCVCNSLWLVAWHSGALGWSVALMLGLLAALIQIYRIVSRRPAMDADYWALSAPFSLYLGWIIVATLVNVSAALVGLGIRAEGVWAVLWAVLLIAVAAGVGLMFLDVQADRVLALVLVWALLGIAVRQWGVDGVVAAAITAIAVLVISMIRRDRPEGRQARS
ncbi:MAG: hypothetical protein SFU83_00535 [Meiothermus sp.]|nr:hypothetical protein [Meiothermus sp.]